MDILQKAQTASTNLQKNAALSVAQMLNDAEATHNKSLLDIKRTKEKLQHTLKNSPALGQNSQSVQQSILQDTPAATTKRK